MVKKAESVNKKQQQELIVAPKVELQYIRLRAIGLTSLLCNNGSHIYQKPLDISDSDLKENENKDLDFDFDDPSLRKRLGIKQERDPKAEYNAARYIIDKNVDGVPAYMFKKAIVSVAHTIIKDISKTVVNRSLWIVAEFKGWLLKIEDCLTPPPIDSRIERINSKGGAKGSPQIRFRPRYDEWTIPFTVEYLKGISDAENIINLLTYGGLCAGICEHRPEKGGEWGRFKVIGEDQYQASKSKKRIHKAAKRK